MPATKYPRKKPQCPWDRNYIEKLIPYTILELIGFIIYIIRQLQRKEREICHLI
jgi:hypothetical protein